MPGNTLMPMSEDMQKRFDEIFKDVPRRNADEFRKQYECEFKPEQKNERVLVKGIKG